MAFNRKLTILFCLLTFSVGFFWSFTGPTAGADRQELIRQRLEAEISDLEEDVTSLKENLKSAESKVQELQEAVEERDEKIDRLEEQKIELEKARRQLQKQLQEVDEKENNKEADTNAGRPGQPVSEGKEKRDTNVSRRQKKFTARDNEQIREEDKKRTGILWLSALRNYPVRRYPLDYELTVEVKDIDTVSRLAHQYYRDASYGPEIYRANADKLPGMETLPEDIKIKLPPFGKLAGKPFEFSISNQPAKLIEQDLWRSGKLWEEKGRSYPVRRQPLDYELLLITGSQDSLTRLAHQYYGDYEYWEALYEFNSDRIGNPDLLPAGTRLRMPPLFELEKIK
ncbi:MAG: hypothetical protein ACQEP7_02090 [bacterium]